MKPWLLIVALAARCEAQAVTVQPGAQALVIRGQSNALGLAYVQPGDEQSIPFVRVMRRDGALYSSAEPLGGSGYGFGRSLAESYLARHPEVPELYVIQCAVSGTPIAKWRLGQEPADVCRVMVRCAQNLGIQVAAEFWLQGEADAKAGNPSYDTFLSEIITAIRSDEGPVPFVAGEIGRFLPQGLYPYRAQIVSKTKAILAKRSGTAFVTSEGLTDRGDRLHYNHDSQDILGQRMDAALASLEMK